MCQAGIEFYDKVRRKNLAIREMSGADLYQENGDEPIGFLQSEMITLNASRRQQYLQLRLKQYQSESEKSKNVETVVAANEQLASQQ